MGSVPLLTADLPICLLLGANGFLGSHVVDAIAQAGGVQVRAFDRYTRPPQFQQHARVAVCKGDIADDVAISQALRGATYLIHSVSATTPFVADTDPYADIHNLLRTVEIFQAAIEAGVRKIVFVSSGGAVYGHAAEDQIASESIVPFPVSPYGICKLAVEHYLEYFKRKFGTEYIVYRISNPYGPRQVIKQSQGVIPAFLHKIMHDEPLTVFGDGSMSRDYIYIEDAARMIAHSFRAANKHPMYNIGSGSQMSINEIIALLERVTKNAIRTQYIDQPKTFLRQANISIERFRDEFGAPALTPFVDGLMKTIEHTFDNAESTAS